MSKQVFINLPVSDLAKSTAFYEALGFTKNAIFSNENASSMMWSDEIIVMLLKPEFYKGFLQGQEVADTQRSNAVLLAISLESAEAVQQFADTAQANGGSCYQVDMGVPSDQMFGYEVLDPDGNHWEPVWMSSDFNPQHA